MNEPSIPQPVSSTGNFLAPRNSFRTGHTVEILSMDGIAAFLEPEELCALKAAHQEIKTRLEFRVFHLSFDRLARLPDLSRLISLTGSFDGSDLPDTVQLPCLQTLALSAPCSVIQRFIYGACMTVRAVDLIVWSPAYKVEAPLLHLPLMPCLESFCVKNENEERESLAVNRPVLEILNVAEVLTHIADPCRFRSISIGPEVIVQADDCIPLLFRELEHHISFSLIHVKIESDSIAKREPDFWVSLRLKTDFALMHGFRKTGPIFQSFRFEAPDADQDFFLQLYEAVDTVEDLLLVEIDQDGEDSRNFYPIMSQNDQRSAEDVLMRVSCWLAMARRKRGPRISDASTAGSRD